MAQSDPPEPKSGPDLASFAPPGTLRLDSLSEQLPELVRELRRYSAPHTIQIVAGLLTQSRFHPNTPRLEALIHLAALHCRGRCKPKRKQLVRWLNAYLSYDKYAWIEDPVEDVFVANLCLPTGNATTFEGIWESGDFHAQQLIDACSTMPDNKETRRLWKCISAFLFLSEAVASRVRAHRFDLSDGSPKEPLDLPTPKALARGSQLTVFTESDLESLGILEEDIDDFVFDWDRRSSLSDEYIGNSSLERYPLLRFQGAITVALPTAFTVALRRFVLEWAAQRDLLAPLTSVLGRQQIRQVMSDALPLLKCQPLPPEESKRKPKTSSFFSAVGSFDKGKAIHVVVFSDELGGCLEEGLLSFNSLSESENQLIQDHITEIAAEYSARSDYTGGISLIVIGGLGRGFSFGLPETPKSWHAVAIGIADLMQLARVEEVSMLRIWKLHEQLSHLSDKGIDFLYVNGLLNLLAYWDENEFGLLPLEFPYASTNGLISIPTDSVTAIRKHLREGYDEHVTNIDDNDWLRVRREHASAFFKEVERLPLYVSYEQLKGGDLYAVVETDSRPWWIIHNHTEASRQHRSLIYRFWDTLSKWLIRAAPYLEARVNDIPSGPVRVVLKFLDVQDWPELSEDTIPEIGDDAGIAWAVENSTINLEIGLPFLRWMMRPDNRGESLLVSAVCAATGEIGETELDSQACAAEILENEDSRFLHFFQAKEYTDYIAGRDSLSPVFIQPEDEANSRLGLSWLVREAKDKDRVKGPEDCGVFLNALPDAIWDRMRSRLATMNFGSLAEKALSNLLAITIDDQQWKMTARAVLALHENRSNIVESAWNRNALRNASSLANRLIIEMGVCTSRHTGGNKVCQSDFDMLVADSILIAHIGQYSDAIRHGYSKADIEITGSGNFKLGTEFYDQVLIPRVTRSFEAGFSASARAYDSYYEKPPGDQSAEKPSDFEQFAEAFSSEFGVAPEDLKAFSELIQAHALATGQLVLRLSDSEAARVVGDELSEDVTVAILNRFSMPIRERWDQSTPPGYRPSDWYPWRFRRRLSLVSKPIVPLAFDDGLKYLIEPAIMELGFRYVIENSFSGALPQEYFDTSEMRAWAGRANNKRGHDFNAHVASRLSECGLCAESEVEVATLGAKGDDRRLGDIDVLVWIEDRRTAIMLECKDLHFAKTVGEVVEQLNRFRGVIDDRGRPDELRKHIQRVEWANNNRPKLAKHFRTSEGDITIENFVVFSNLVPMRFFSEFPVEPERIVDVETLIKRIQNESS